MNSKNLSGHKPHQVSFLSEISEPKIIVSLILLTFIIYMPVLKADFLWYDDDMMVFNNPFITSLSFNTILKFFSFENIVHYHPLVTISYAVEYSFFGLNPLYYHLDNLFLHCANVILVYYLIYSLKGDKSIAVIAAVLFAVHPLHVESVAWVTERKDMLFSLFYLGSLIFYVKFSKKPLKKFYIFAFALFIMSCLSKAMAVTLPFVLLLFELTLLNSRKAGSGKSNRLNKLILIIPFFIVSVLTAFINLKVAYYETDIAVYSLYERIALVCYAILFYPFKMLFPFELSAIYGFPRQPGTLIIISPFVLSALLMLFFLKRKSIKEYRFGFLFYIITIIPVLPFLPFGISAAADRFSYIPMIGLLYFAAVLLAKFYYKYAPRRHYDKYFGLCLALVTLFFSVLTFNRAGMWENTEVLMNDVLKKDAESYHAYYILGNYYSSVNKNEKAISSYLNCIRLKDNYSEVYYNLGNVYFTSGRLHEAEQSFLKAVALNPKDKLAHNNLGVTYENMGEYEKAFRHYRLSAELGYMPAKNVLEYYGVK